MKHATIIGLAAIISVSGCLGGPAPADIAVASYPATFIAEALAPDELRIVTLGAAGVHGFEPSVNDLAQLEKTDHLLLWDEALESWAHRAERSLADQAPAVFEMTRMPAGESFLAGEDDGHGHGATDPHTWSDPLAVQGSVNATAAYLQAAYPEHATAIQANAEATLARLQDLHAAYTTAFDDCSRDTIITNHESHNYLAARYGFTVFALHGLEPGAQPSVDTVEEAIRIIEETGAPVIFVEEGTDPGSLAAIWQETDVAIRSLYTGESPPAAGDLLDGQMATIAHLQTALGCT